MTGSYANAAAFRQALEVRIRKVAEDRAVQIQGLRLKVSIERLLARLFLEPDPPWLLKGGFAMELRFRPKARSTRDLDLTLSEEAGQGHIAGQLVAVHEALMLAAGRPLEDHFEFIIPPARSELAAAPGGGGVFGVTARVAGREFARFHLDIGFGDPVLGAPDRLVGDDLLAFAAARLDRRVSGDGDRGRDLATWHRRSVFNPLRVLGDTEAAQVERVIPTSGLNSPPPPVPEHTAI